MDGKRCFLRGWGDLGSNHHTALKLGLVIFILIYFTDVFVRIKIEYWTGLCIH